MSGRLLLLAASAFAAGFAPAPLPRHIRGPAAEGGLKKLQGNWVVVEERRGGRKLPGSSSTGLSIVQDRWAFYVDGRVVSRWKARLDPSATPRKVDLLSEDGGGVSAPAIFRFEGDTLYF